MQVRKMKGERGQASVELTFALAIFLFMALVAYPYVTRNSELSKCTAAARDGATYGIAMLNLGYTPPSYGGTPPRSPYKLRSVDYSISGTTVTFACSINGTSDTAVNDEVKRQMMRFVYKSVSGDWPASDPATVTGGHYTYQATDCTFG